MVVSKELSLFLPEYDALLQCEALLCTNAGSLTLPPDAATRLARFASAAAFLFLAAVVDADVSVCLCAEIVTLLVVVTQPLPPPPPPPLLLRFAETVR